MDYALLTALADLPIDDVEMLTDEFVKRSDNALAAGHSPYAYLYATLAVACITTLENHAHRP